MDLCEAHVMTDVLMSLKFTGCWASIICLFSHIFLFPWMN